MKVLVCGGREYKNLNRVHQELDLIRETHKITQIISGGARGADNLAELYAKNKNIPCRIFPANWDKYGKKAGYIRNKQMVDEGKPDFVVAFPGGTGTQMMISIAESADIPVHVVDDTIVREEPITVLTFLED